MASFDFHIIAYRLHNKFSESVSPYLVIKSTGTRFKKCVFESQPDSY